MSNSTNNNNSSNNSNSNTLFLIGGTGGLGYEVAQGLVTAQGFASRKALVRDPTSAKAVGLQSMGWELVPFREYSNPTALQEVLRGARSTIVSTLSGGDMVTLEKAIIDAAKANGTTRLFVPSQFGVDYRRWGTTFPFLAGKKQVLDYAQEQGLATLAVFCGFFADWIFDFLASPEQGKARLIGDGSGKVSFTKRSDIGYVLAKALEEVEDHHYDADHSAQEQQQPSSSTLSIAGSTLSYKEALDLLSTALGIKSLELETIDPMEAKVQEAELLEKGLKGDMGAFFGSFGLHLMGEPQRGNTGADTSAEAKTYGVELEPLSSVLLAKYGDVNNKKN